MFARLRNARALGLASALLFLVLAGSADAAPRKLSRREPQKISNAQLHEALRVLQATKKTLQAADHDYGGHRAEAVKAIDAAERQLRLALGMPTNAKKTGRPGNQGKRPGKGGKQSEPQAVSNLQLAEAIAVLQKTATFLEKADHDYGGHRAAAVRDLGLAIRQLKLALKFEKK